MNRILLAAASHLRVPPGYASTMAGLIQRAGVDLEVPSQNNPRNPVPVRGTTHSIHAIACPSEDAIRVGELINWRVQKLEPRGSGSR